MGWPYHFLTLSKEDVLVRRHTIDHYARIALFSALAPALIAILVRLVLRAARPLLRLGRDGGDRGRYSHIPGSPTVKAQRSSGFGALASRWRALMWWLGDDVVLGGMIWGQRDEWVLGLFWTSWLLVLCVLGTGEDYLHLTKRFGTIAVSQLPIQYLLALKALNPYAYAFNSSHEHINRYHRTLGRIIYALIMTHIVFYNVFFILSGIWLKRFFAPVVFCGVLAALSFDGLFATALVRARQYSYRLFFITHLGVALLAPVLLFFHAHSARVYVAGSVIVFLADIAYRRFTMTHTASTFETVPGTNLIKISAPMPAEKIEQFRSRPGSHIYLSIPPEGRTSKYPTSKSFAFDLLFNPFTVASANQDSQSITLVARKRTGPMTNILSQFADPTSSPPSLDDNNNITLAIEGPHGAIGKHFQNLLTWGASRILLVAGGVGATFALPLFHALQRELPSAHTQFVWAIRSAADATWAMTGNDSDKPLLDDDNVHLYLTENIGISTDANGRSRDASIELQNMGRGSHSHRSAAANNSRRPNFQKIVDDMFRHGVEEKVAVLVCGPEGMSREVRRRIGPWVLKGREVWWHNESFGW
ncbi:ferric reductase NAD binding domain-containing protein [Trichoderma breve]|uniref:Ferric reductase NAD binding domain-containing protein n=1 Tax=Trichoderma breve TaxID=2034170 RepID=A0A9W9E8G8_9HYPO|nr:ferric reductase NAD binding domain-containing protein [Trichoderma breve]KAJ4861934.1 ferric reductase NAD binding domain-containing protein [Trichoderma breve]